MPEPPPLERALFREAADGTTVFFPWGLHRRGYRLPDAAAKQKASRAASLLLGSTIAIGTWTAYALQPLLEPDASGASGVVGALVGPGVALLVSILGYVVWVARFVERFPESDLEISREERLREAARAASPWQMTLVGFVLCGLSGLLVWLRPHAWWLGLLGVALGAGTLSWSWTLERARREPGD